MKLRTIFTGSFYSAQAYADMRTKGRGWAMGYSFLLVTVTTSLLLALSILLLNNIFFTSRNGQPMLFDDLAHQLGEQWPGSELKDNVLTVHAPMPYYIHLKIPMLGYVIQGDFITIDTTGKTTPQNMKTPFLITATEAIRRYHDDQGKPTFTSESLSDFNPANAHEIIITPTRARALADHATGIVHHNLWKIYLALSLIVWLGFFLLRLFMLFLVATAGILIGIIQHSKISFSAAMRLTAMAYTPVALIDLATMLAAYIWLPRFLLFLMGCFMLAVAIRVTREQA